MKRPFLLIVAATGCLAQTPPLVPSLIEYLDLTGTQITRLRQNANEFNTFYREKAARYAQVSRELDEEYSREVVDPLALGQRYIEHEAICRELRTAFSANYDKNQTVLTEAQKTKLRALDGVVNTTRLASAAAGENLMDYPGGFPFGRASAGLATGGGIVGIDPTLLGSLGLGTGSGLFGGICGVPMVNANPTMSGTAKKGASAK